MFPPIKTGTSFYSRNLANALRARGHAITVITLENAETPASNLPYLVHRLRAWHIPALRFFKHFRVCSLFPRNYRTIGAIARSNDIEAVVLVNHYLDIAFPAIYAARAASAPLVCSVGTQLQSSVPWRDRALNFFDRMICGGMIFPYCDRLVAWDKEVLRYLSDVQGPGILGKCSIINFGVNGDPAAFHAYQHDFRLHNQILAIGSVIRQRSYVPLIQAFARLAAEFPALRLKIIGHVYFEEPVKVAERLSIADKVTFTGELAHEEVLQELQRSDLYFVSLTARYLGLGTATLESMLMGVPTVANVPADLLGKARLKDREDIVLLKDLSPEHISEKLRSLIESRDLRRRIGQGGRAFVNEHMNWGKVASDYEELLRSLPSNASP